MNNPFIPSPVAESCEPGIESLETGMLSGMYVIHIGCDVIVLIDQMDISIRMNLFILNLFSAKIIRFFLFYHSCISYFCSLNVLCREMGATIC